MASLVVIPLIGAALIFFLLCQLLVFILFILTIVFGILRAVKKKFRKTWIVLLIVTIIAMVGDGLLIHYVFNFQEIEQEKEYQKLLKEEGKELMAIREYDYDQVKAYIEQGWNINETNKAIFYAIKYNPDSEREEGKWRILELLLENGANPDVQISDDPKGVNTPLTYAAQCGYYEVAKLLLDYGASINYQENYFERTPIHALRFYQKEDAFKILQLFLKEDVDFEIQDYFGITVREELQNFEKNYGNEKEDVPHYEEIKELIDSTIYE